MSGYEPPTEDLPIFDPTVFLTGDEPLTYNTAVKKFLKYPYAQGTENLLDVNITGKVGQTIAGIGNIQYGDKTSLALRTTGDFNTCVGTHCGDAITTASNSTIIGSFAGDSVSTGSDNTLIGKSSGHIVSSGSTNVLIGSEPAMALSTGSSNVVIGKHSLNQVSSGSSNVVVGVNAMNTSGGNAANNTVMGNNSCNNQQAQNCVYIGANAGDMSLATVGPGSGSDKIGIGYQSGKFYQSGGAIAIGKDSGLGLATSATSGQGLNSIAIGFASGKLSQAANSVAIGADSGATNQGQYSVSVGEGSGNLNQATKNCAFGHYAGGSNQASQASAFGFNAGLQNQGINSLCLGANAGSSSCGANSVIVNGSGLSQNALTNQIILNASSSQIAAATLSACYMAPLRNVTGTYLAQYNSTTKELSYSNTAPAIIAPVNIRGLIGGETQPILTLETTDPDNLGSFIKIDKASVSPEPDDVIGGIIFTNNDSLGAEQPFAKIYSRAIITTTGATRGKLGFSAFQGASEIEFLGYNTNTNNLNIAPTSSMNTFFGLSGACNIYYGGSTPANTASGSVIVTNGSRIDTQRTGGVGSAYKLRIGSAINPTSDTNNIIDAGITTANSQNYLTIGSSTIPAETTCNGNLNVVGNGNAYGAGTNSLTGLPLSNTAETTYNMRYYSYDPCQMASTSTSFNFNYLYGTAYYLPAGITLNRITLYQYATSTGTFIPFIYRQDGTNITTGAATVGPAGINRCFSIPFSSPTTITTSDLYFVGFYVGTAAVTIAATTNNMTFLQTPIANTFNLKSMRLSSLVGIPSITGTPNNNTTLPFVMIS